MEDLSSTNLLSIFMHGAEVQSSAVEKRQALRAFFEAVRRLSEALVDEPLGEADVQVPILGHADEVATEDIEGEIDSVEGVSGAAKPPSMDGELTQHQAEEAPPLIDKAPGQGERAPAAGGGGAAPDEQAPDVAAPVAGRGIHLKMHNVCMTAMKNINDNFPPAVVTRLEALLKRIEGKTGSERFSAAAQRWADFVPEELRLEAIASPMTAPKFFYANEERILNTFIHFLEENE